MTTDDAGLSLVLISTSDVEGGRAEKLDRMIATVAAFATRHPGIPVTHMLLLQNARDPAARTWPPFVETSHVPGRLSLSAARNRLIARIRDRGGFGDDVVVLFPDDDCWYPDGVLDGIVGAFRARPRLDFWFCPYSSAPQSYAPGLEVPATAADVTRRASSNTFAFRGRIFADGSGFDETLGVGTPNGGGEDTAFALVTYGQARETLFLDRACIGHPDPDPGFMPRYYRGALLAIAGSAQVPGVRAEFVRKLMIGVYLVLARRLPLRRFLGDAADGCAGFLRARRSPRP
ncbi:glycosyltransferase family A protein [uncultured Methylobacterium sp.]|uniref:glycosyltransferase family A protein n=1 Tax=uncultured Methylobacterium sp. TaxID=157278 RepID=UPI00261E1969|nr:glycosyltransferase family A protein [uncultured Methylobacterium sp.]